MKTDELVISEDYRYYVTREGKLAVLMCDLTKVPVDVPFEMLDGKDVFVFFLPDQVKTEEVTLISCYQGGRFCGIKNSDDIVGCLYFAGGYKEAKLELQANMFRTFVCCDESDVVGAVYYPKEGTAWTFGLIKKDQRPNGIESHSLARSIAESIARGDGKWLEATTQSLQSRREAVQRRIDEREEFPQYWTTRPGDSSHSVAYVIRVDQKKWKTVYKDGHTYLIEHVQFEQYDRTRLTKEQAEALLDKPKAKSARERVAELLYEVKMLAEGDCNWVSDQCSILAGKLSR